MRVHTAQLAGGDDNADRVFVTDNAVIVLDGASAFEPVDVDPGIYAETLGAVIADQLDADPQTEIADAVAVAIAHAVEKLDLRPGHSPSSTVSALRVRGSEVDLYVLGDSPIHYGTASTTHELTDSRLAGLPITEYATYTANLRAGHGYGDEHQAALVALQRAQAAYRNVEHGYWIAETDPEAAHHAISTAVDRDTIAWAVLTTDGAVEPLAHLGRNDWADIAHYDDEQLAELLAGIDLWEQHHDPHGTHLPRAKRHDDKTIAAVSFTR